MPKRHYDDDEDDEDDDDEDVTTLEAVKITVTKVDEDEEVIHGTDDEKTKYEIWLAEGVEVDFLRRRLVVEEKHRVRLARGALPLHGVAFGDDQRCWLEDVDEGRLAGAIATRKRDVGRGRGGRRGGWRDVNRRSPPPGRLSRGPGHSPSGSWVGSAPG